MVIGVERLRLVGSTCLRISTPKLNFLYMYLHRQGPSQFYAYLRPLTCSFLLRNLPEGFYSSSHARGKVKLTPATGGTYTSHVTRWREEKLCVVRVNKNVWLPSESRDFLWHGRSQVYSLLFCTLLCFFFFFLNCSFFPSFLLFESIVLLDLSIISTNYQLKFYFNSVINSRKFEKIV